MALFASIKCEGLEIVLAEDVINSYDYSYKLDDVYAKTNPESIKMMLELDVNEILSGESNSLEENKELLENLREWGKDIFSEPGDQYYRRVTLTHTFGNELFKEIELSHAYLENFIEDVNLERGRHTIKIELVQKRDKLFRQKVNS